MISSTTTQQTNKTRSRDITAASDCTPPPSPTRADDTGFTPAEIIIGVILVAILATGVTVKAVQLMGRARDSAGQTTLRTAVAAAQAVYANMLPGGYNNYSGVVPVAGVIATAEVNTVLALKREEPGITFLEKNEGTGAYGDLSDSPPRPQTIWVSTIDTAAKEVKVAGTGISSSSWKANPNGSTRNTADIPSGNTITAGDLVRLGVIAATGNSFCVILVSNDSHGRVTGEGWQATSEALTQSTANDTGADCGDENSAPFREMPDTPGTDSKPSAIVVATDTTKDYTKP